MTIIIEKPEQPTELQKFFMSKTPLTNKHRSRLRTVAESTAFEEELERRLNACVEALESIPVEPSSVYWNYRKKAIANARNPLLKTY